MIVLGVDSHLIFFLFFVVFIFFQLFFIRLFLSFFRIVFIIGPHYVVLVKSAIDPVAREVRDEYECKE